MIGDVIKPFRLASDMKVPGGGGFDGFELGAVGGGASRLVGLAATFAAGEGG